MTTTPEWLTDEPAETYTEPARRSITVPHPLTLVRMITFRVLLIVMIGAAALFSAGSWWENHKMTEGQCAYIAYDYDGAKVKALTEQGQALNDAYHCGLDLPLAEPDNSDL